MKLNKYLIILGFIAILALFVRVYKLDSIPPSVSWDEAAVGYNAYTIANWGRDETGKVLPVSFKSFGDDKNPVHIYATAVVVKLFGLSVFTTRLAPALFGVLNVILLYFIGRYFFSSYLVGLVSAFFLAVSPYSIQFSRFNHEANFALFFFMLGLLLFYLAVNGKKSLLVISFLSFGVSLLVYHSAKVFTPLMMVVMIFLYWKKLYDIKKYLIISFIAFLIPVSVIVFNSELLGIARIKQNAISEKDLQATTLYQKTQNLLFARAELMSKYYLSHFDYKYLFVSGDPIPRHSSQVVGEFYKIDAILLVVGLVTLLKLRTKESLLLVIWAILAPIPASFSPGANGWGHAARALFVMGSWHIIAGVGFVKLLSLAKKFELKLLLAVVILLAVCFEFKIYLTDYYQNYSKEHAMEWQYGFEQIGDFIKAHPEYHTVFVTDIRSQPYIFMLFYLKIPLPEYLQTVRYNLGPNRPSSLVSSFGKYFFTDWDPIESQPIPRVLYVVGPSDFDGLRHKDLLSVKKLVKLPNGNDAFFLVSYP